jgi:hypothetical protein
MPGSLGGSLPNFCNFSILAILGSSGASSVDSFGLIVLPNSVTMVASGKLVALLNSVMRDASGIFNVFASFTSSGTVASFASSGTVASFACFAS